MRNTRLEPLIPVRRGHKRGFTLTEMLVVLAITAVLLTVLFIPLSESLKLTTRGNSMSQAQDSVRTAMRRVARELANAVVVYEPRPLRIFGYANLGTDPKRAGVPAFTAQTAPEGYLLRNGVVAMRLPKQQYYCKQFDHVVTNVETISPDAALDSCPRHAGSPVELRPVSPVQPSNLITAYFIGLKDPGRVYTAGTQRSANPWDDQGQRFFPVYENIALFRRVFAAGAGPVNKLNTYVLYRVEFDPADPRFQNWNLPAASGGGPNPDFFYNTAQAPNGRRYYQNWLDNATAFMDSELSDAVSWVQMAGKWLPEPLCTFGPSPVEEEVAAPNRSVGQFLVNGTELPAPLPATEFALDHSNWVGWQAEGEFATPNGGRVIPDSIAGLQRPFLMAPTATLDLAGGSGVNSTIALGPRIQVIDQGQVVFDTLAPAPRQRLVSFDSVTGRVLLGIQRWNANGDAVTREHYAQDAGTIVPVNAGDPYFSISLANDVNVADANGMPTSFGSVLQAQQNGNPRYPFARIVPGSEQVLLAERNGGALVVSEPLRRAGWLGLGFGLDRLVAQSELKLDEYSINYQTGEISFADRDPSYWQMLPAGGQRQILVRYRIQTNKPTDTVRVSYLTKEQALVNLGVVQYTRAHGDIIPFQVAERVVIRNLRR